MYIVVQTYVYMYTLTHDMGYTLMYVDIHASS